VSVFRFLTAGESHGPGLTTIVEGIPAGLPLRTDDVDLELGRRQRGYGRGGRMKIERDAVRFVGGVRGGETLGGPIAMTIENRDHASWLDRMGAGPFAEPPEPLTRPRPGHADLAGGLKYDRRDLRDVLERASARETASRVAVGAVCRVMLRAIGIDVVGHVTAIGGVAATASGLTIREIAARVDESDVGCADPASSEAMREAIKSASHAGDTVGGTFEVIAAGVPVGLGSHVAWDRRLDGRLAQALMSIQAIKGVEIGVGMEAAARRGSEVHDAIGYDMAARRFTRSTNRAGGIEGGISNGEPIVARAAMKPIATLRRALPSVDVRTKEPFEAAFERSDVCAVPAAAVVGEAMVAIVLAEAVLEKFGGDSLTELQRNVEGFRQQLQAYG
jgi:chorismate synthase